MRDSIKRFGYKFRYLILVVVVAPTTLLVNHCLSARTGYTLPGAQAPGLDRSALEGLQMISKGISEIANHAKKGIVFVSTQKIVQNPFGGMEGFNHPFFDFFFGPEGNPFGEEGGRSQRPQQRGNRAPTPERRQQGLGSGFFVDLKNGYIMTNNHVIEGADEINLKLDNGKNYTGKIVGRDKNTDVAIVQINEKNFDKTGLVEMSLGDSNAVSVGDLCLAVGAPFGLEASVSMGVVSALSRGSLSITEYGNFIQTDAAINPGNSGGPLIGVKGEVIGMNTAIYSKSGAYNGIGFAIPSNLARDVANQLINGGKVVRGFLGVMLQDVDEDLRKKLAVPDTYKNSVLVRTVESGSPAEKGGLEAGDVVVQLDGKGLTDVQDLRNQIGLKQPGSTIDLLIIRDGKPRNVKIVLGNLQEGEEAKAKSGSESGTDGDGFGISLQDVSSRLRSAYGFRVNQGAVVVKIDPGSPAEAAGLVEGDVIVNVDRLEVKNAKDFAKLTRGKDQVFVRFDRRGRFNVTNMMR